MQAPILPEDELTLNEIKRYMKQLRYFLLYVFGHYIGGIRRYPLLIALLMVLVAGLASYSYLNPALHNEYEAKASYTYNMFQKKFYGEMADKLNALVETHSYGQLATLLGVSEKELQGITHIKAVNIYNSRLSEDMAEKGSQKLFYVEVAATGSTVFNFIGSALERYFNKNIAVREATLRQLTEIRQGIIYKQKQRLMLDSLIRSYTNSLYRSQPVPYGLNAAPFDALSLLNKGDNLTQELADMQLYVADPRNVKLQGDFLISVQLPGLSLVKLLVISLGCFVLISAFILFILSLIKQNRHDA